MIKQDYHYHASKLDEAAGLGLDVVKSPESTWSELSNHQPKKPFDEMHPLANFVTFDGKVNAPRWVIPGFIAHGVTVISGAPGVGKTTAILPLAMTAAGLHGDEALMPNQWRHVVYVTEDIEQVRRILAGVIGFSNLNVDIELALERLHIVEAVRLTPEYVAKVGEIYRDMFTRKVNGIEVKPLVVFDTKSAVLVVENENDNSEASKMMAALKQGFDGLPVWLISHVAKPISKATAVASMTTRGASAIDGDANQTIFLVQEKTHRFFVIGKVRFAPKWPELEITSHTAQTTIKDEFGFEETVVLMWGITKPMNQNRLVTLKEAKDVAVKLEETKLRDDIRDVVQSAWQSGHPLNRSRVKSKIHRKAQTVSNAIENLLSERWLHEVEVPSKVRLANSKKAFLINLTTEEHDMVISGGELPADKLVIPASWLKRDVSIVPESVEKISKTANA